MLTLPTDADDLPFSDVRVWDPDAPGLVGPAPRRRQSRDDYAATGGYTHVLPGAPPQADMMATLETALSGARLHGRGGAAFPTLVKLRSVAAAARDAGRSAVVVANGAEGEPLSYKDRYLLRYRPHAVLDGLLLVSAAVGADTAYVYMADSGAQAIVTTAVDELEAKRGGGPAIRIFPAQDTYVAGEETAAVRSINTGIARPTDKPPRPYRVGVDGAPTLILNVETLAWLARAAIPGTTAGASGFLATVSRTGTGTVLYELPTGLALGELVRDYTGRDSSRGNVLMGGFFGGLLPVWPRLPLSVEAVRDAGSSLGCGSLHFLDPDVCPMRVAAEVVGYFAEHNARQCRSCMSSSATIAAALASLARPAPHAGLERKLPRWSTRLPGTGACSVPDGVAVLLRTLLRHYPRTVAQHIDEGCAQCAAAQHDELRPPQAQVSDPRRELTVEAIAPYTSDHMAGAS